MGVRVSVGVGVFLFTRFYFCGEYFLWTFYGYSIVLHFFLRYSLIVSHSPLCILKGIFLFLFYILLGAFSLPSSFVVWVFPFSSSFLVWVFSRHSLIRPHVDILSPSIHPRLAIFPPFVHHHVGILSPCLSISSSSFIFSLSVRPSS